MNSQQASRINGGNTAYERKEGDFYPTPPDTTQALLNFLNISKTQKIWECACGEGHMSQAIENNGYIVESTDLMEQCYGSGGIDFLQTSECIGDWIITNPPFKLAESFIRKAFAYGVPFAMLLKSQYWHSKGRYSLFNTIKPSYILPLTWRPDFLFKTRGSGSPLMDCMWCVWDNNNQITQYIPLQRPLMMK